MNIETFKQKVNDYAKIFGKDYNIITMSSENGESCDDFIFEVDKTTKKIIIWTK